MGMGQKRHREPEADASAGLVSHRTTAHEYPDNELGHFRHHPTYSLWGAVKYILVLSVLLWWLPTIGQMIAGYIGGRRAGGQWRGVVAGSPPPPVHPLLFLAPPRRPPRARVPRVWNEPHRPRHTSPALLPPPPPPLQVR